MLWHPAKWWLQDLTSAQLIANTTTCALNDEPPVTSVKWPDRTSPQLLSDPPGQLDSGRYMWDMTATPPEPLPFYYQCFSCCCTPAKCAIPQEILMTISGFSGMLSSIDRPSAFGYAPGNSCPECNIMWVGDCDPPGHRFTGYTADCCQCRKTEDFYWWPCTANSVPLIPSTLCDIFPHLCSSTETTGANKRGRIAARYINPCVSYFNGPSPCTDFVWSDDPVDGSGTGYSLVELTDCANAPEADARRDYNCITRERIDFVRENDSYLPPPGFRGPGAVNLLPLNGPFCDDKFWNDTTYYRFCVGSNANGTSGNFWCQGPCWYNHCYCEGGWWGLDQDFFWRLSYNGANPVRDNQWRDSQWCENAPTRCSGVVPVDEVRWRYYRPRHVLISQPSRQNCMLCPGYGFGYGSDASNYGRGQDWYDPYDDGNCIGKTDVPMSDFNQTFMMYAEVTPEPPYLQAVVDRARNLPDGETRLINAELLFQLKQYVQGAPPNCTCFQYKQGFWNLDYPCEQKSWSDDCKCVICAIDYGTVAPKLRAFYLGGEGGDAVINFHLKQYCSPLRPSGVGQQMASPTPTPGWYVSAVFVDEESRGAGYEVDDEFVFDFYESPLRGGEFVVAGIGGTRQKAKVTKVGADGEILGIALIVPEDMPQLYTKCANASENPMVFIPWVPLYWRYLAHRNAVAIPGNGYIEGDVLTFENIGAPPNAPMPTGSRYYPYMRTNSRYKTRAQVTVLEVDSRGGIVDWYMCGAKNDWIPFLKTEAENTCADDHTGIYYSDYQYTNRCEYNYVGYIPVKYGWSGWFDYHFHKETYCGYAWAKFTFKLDQISVKNTVHVLSPLGPLDAPLKKPVLRIKTVQQMVLYNEAIEPLRYQNYERSPGPNARTTRFIDAAGGNYAWFKNHDIPIAQGAVVDIEVVEPGAGYVTKIMREDGTHYWEPMDVSTESGAIKIFGVADDIRAYAEECWGWPAFCKCHANIIMDEDDPNFGGIDSITVDQGGLWYFVHPQGHDHLWFAKAGSDWYFELATPASQENPNPVGVDFSDINGAPCWHASRDNWGELQHKAGFYEPYPAGYHEQIHNFGDTVFKSYSCSNASGWQWPQNINTMGGEGVLPVQPPNQRWSLNFCPHDLLTKQFTMLLIHPCAACAKELAIPGAQTCWNMNGFGDTTYAFYPNQWSGTGTAMIDRLGGPLTMTTSLPLPNTGTSTP